MDVPVPVLLQVREEHGRQRASETQADDVRLVLTGDLADDLERPDRPVELVVVEGHEAHGLVGVAIADREHRVSVLDRPLGEAPLRCEVHDVVLVDPGGAEKQRHPVDRLGLRRILDELHEVVAEHDLPRRHREVLADGERAARHLAGKPPVRGDVVQEVAQSADQAQAAGVERLLPGRRAGPEEVGGREPVHREFGEESDLLALDLVQARGRHHVLDPAPAEQVGLEEHEEGGIARPRRVAEAPILGRGREGSLGGAAEHARARRGGSRDEPHAEADSRLHDRLRMLEHTQHGVDARFTEGQRVEVRERTGLGLQGLCRIQCDLARSVAIRRHQRDLLGAGTGCGANATDGRARSGRGGWASERPDAIPARRDRLTCSAHR